MHSSARHLTMESPLGRLAVAAVDEGLTYVHMGVEEVEETWGPEEPTPVLEAAVDQLSAYFAGDLKEFDLPLAPVGTAFQRRVWAELAKIPYGETCSYLEVAERIGDRKAVRAVGLANGRNPIAIVVPCHRVIGANGRLTGYAGGLWRKERLLSLERGEPALFL
ncbi:methylated-DNA--[protein]-cysteine S-methyltransferase [Glycomyces sp. TRM65418]|uniref:methylated-DNA--[protein]-cysteine S-methyltransferase n=1 Tax=Glycomyces sp. TRM65418 TaxID=2867006 RepID=UPI001CE58209|nr:methylated-DNA--[protein]-cysteine S-methyltransferase [Glycomyces sp. TRM65418]MCC3763275.1 methylated-DNA--[protein]-cysteine S-methyltransferase [Glycomyces sp. TRM65418]QZD57275.1 methylated-DNA--[protein]-cysteine S-methyltransferase [Glycomyces sp. TRM65418]